LSGIDFVHFEMTSLIVQDDRGVYFISQIILYYMSKETILIQTQQ
jgi:hypothetical protein